MKMTNQIARKLIGTGLDVEKSRRKDSIITSAELTCEIGYPHGLADDSNDEGEVVGYRVTETRYYNYRSLEEMKRKGWMFSLPENREVDRTCSDRTQEDGWISENYDKNKRICGVLVQRTNECQNRSYADLCELHKCKNVDELQDKFPDVWEKRMKELNESEDILFYPNLLACLADGWILS